MFILEKTKEWKKNKENWLVANGFNEEGITYFYCQKDSYDIRKELREAGFLFNQALLWHCPCIPEGYSDKVVPILAKDIVDFSIWGEGYYHADIKQYIQDILNKKNAAVAECGEWLDEVEGARLYDIPAEVQYIKDIYTNYGYQKIITFLTLDKNIKLRWFTKVNFKYSIGDKILLTATIKSKIIDNYAKKERITLITRCKVTAAES